MHVQFKSKISQQVNQLTPIMKNDLSRHWCKILMVVTNHGSPVKFSDARHIHSVSISMQYHTHTHQRLEHAQVPLQGPPFRQNGVNSH